MGKRRNRGESSEHGSPKKKHKKNKKHKHSNDDSTAVQQRPITLKIKLGDQLISSSTSEIPILPGDDTSSIAESEPQSLMGASSVGVAEDEWAGSDDISIGKEDSNGMPASNIPSDDEDEEEAWLEALETGDVNERGYLPKKNIGTTLTARQRAMLGEEDVNELVELPLGKASNEMTEEMLLKKSEKNQKRKLAAQKRKEKRKAETVRKLLEKQSTKKKEDENPKLPSKPSVPHMRYINSSQLSGVGATLSLPEGMEFPLKPDQQPCPPPAQPQKCSIKDCNNTKRYSDSVTHLPLCSLACYKKLKADTTKLWLQHNTLEIQHT